MAERTFPNVGLKGGYDPHETGWGDSQNLNLLTLSVITQGVFDEKVSALPGAPDPGTVIILDETNGDNPNQIAVFEGPVGDEEWTYIVPGEGWLLYNKDAEYYEKFDGTVWAELETGGGGGGIPDAPSDGQTYGRKDADWVEIISGGGGPSVVQTEAADYTVAPGDNGHYIRLTAVAAKSVTVDPEATTALPDNGEWHFRNVGAGDATLIEGSGVTINLPAGGTLVLETGMTVTLKRVAEDEFDLLGQTVVA